MTRIVVLGNCGAGKTTLAAELSRSLRVPHVELDALHHEAGWVEAPDDVFRARVAAAVAADAWIVDGNYGKARDLVWPRATRIVWLDLPRRVVMRRVIWRTVSRAVTRRELWNGNRERVSTFLAAEHPIRWSWNTHAPRRAEYSALMDGRWVRLRTPAAVRAWVRDSAALPRE